ncbi:trifunctional transcriptional regulator/proline dehydrogenase/pyrroline-5-carboxylate dehydrogenase [mine drainage metagenome]|uniref:Trifunctional transcriptional regulator/proline dehydrogenase/pyrroline-5-carboxylate dehydrogenase n=1 Tax=mine drainage metagenome TaxID=410659 RepID=A0A1J5Q9I9_9ZZZZ
MPAIHSTAARPTTLKLDPDTRERLKRLADARRRTPHWMMLEAIHQYVDREERREALRQAAMQAWEEYQETGLHLTGDEVVAWLQTWGEDNEAAAPACHR